MVRCEYYSLHARMHVQVSYYISPRKCEQVRFFLLKVWLFFLSVALARSFASSRRSGAGGKGVRSWD